ncbi:Mn2+/Fe2- transporter, NRAMP family protein [Halorubrum coriense DSM 10284]|uniref:Mn2+/Fe2-transporter, NRAMP family protein n=1 Tax=Halorubrum coriense DSM 10284 TaxID=1227466 RepID=M0E9X0_9EURY|nr:divalent metal cation transporter [Halorubrum coriense]ELZ43682.1 Mn2+/Fe2- transporter, NRAMP family protein [Halorubrum coriense DSM 10284]
MAFTRLYEQLSGMGPAWLPGAIAAGPATISALVAAGVGYGYDLLWVVVLSAPAGFVALLLAARLGTATERGIVRSVEDRLGKWWAWLLVVDTVIVAGVAQLLIMKGLADVSASLFGLVPPVWGVFWAVVLVVGLAGGGYRVAEIGAKVVVSAVVLVFVATLVVVPPDPAAAAAGLVPTTPPGAAVTVAGVLGGAVHITLVTMYTYTMRAREWGSDDYGLARFDAGASMLVAFGLYSLSIFLVVAGALGGRDVAPQAAAAAAALVPVAGSAAVTLFLVGILGAAVSTLGGNTVVPPFLLADKLGWGTTIDDGRYRALLAGTALVSAAGAFVGGSFIPLLVQALALGLVGTPFVLALVLYLLYDVPGGPPSRLLTGSGVILLGVTSVTAANAVRDTAATLTDGLAPIPAFVTLFAVVLGLATLALLALLVREWAAGWRRADRTPG